MSRCRRASAGVWGRGDRKGGRFASQARTRSITPACGTSCGKLGPRARPTPAGRSPPGSARPRFPPVRDRDGPRPFRSRCGLSSAARVCRRPPLSIAPSRYARRSSFRVLNCNTGSTPKKKLAQPSRRKPTTTGSANRGEWNLHPFDQRGRLPQQKSSRSSSCRAIVPPRELQCEHVHRTHRCRTRPEAIKTAPVIRDLSRRPDEIRSVVCSTVNIARCSIRCFGCSICTPTMIVC